jgi:hypothetical protein
MKSILIATVAMLAFAGCANYQLGTTLPEALRAVHVPSVRNDELLEPGLDALATSAILREVQREGTLVLTDADQAATRLDIAIVRFRMEPIRYQRDDTRTPGEYRATLTADVTFLRLSDGKPIYRGVVEGETTLSAVSDLGSAKTATLPDACDDLARKILERCTSAW